MPRRASTSPVAEPEEVLENYPLNGDQAVLDLEEEEETDAYPGHPDPQLEETESDSSDAGEEEAFLEEPDPEVMQLEEAVEDSPFGIWSAETAEKKGLKVLLYGPSGAGKTRMAATFPRPLFLDLESGLRTTLQVGPVLRYPANPRQEITDLGQVKEFFKLVKRAGAAGNAPFETVVIDSLNELQLLVMANVVGKFAANRQYDDQPTMADYGKIIKDFTSIVRMFLKLPFHVVFTAVETPREFPEQMVMPQFIGKKTGPEIQRIMEMIGYCHVVPGPEGPTHQVSFHSSPTYIAKDRMGIAERHIPNEYDAIVGSATV